jgi:hypothetical protein
MNGRITIPDPEDVQDYLRSFDSSTRQAGERLWRQQRVTQLVETKRNDDYLEFQALVRDRVNHRVELAHDG